MHTLRIKNVRCYEDKEIVFRRGVNVLIGDNAAGKTSLLRACALVMNAFFAGYSEKYTRWESAKNEDFRFWYTPNGTKAYAPKMEIEFDAYDTDFLPVRKNDGTEIQLSENSTFKIEKNSKKNSNPLKSGIKPLIDYCKALKENSHWVEGGELTQKNTLPLYAVFSTDDIHSQSRKFDKTGFREEYQIPSFGYFNCEDTRSLFGLWVKRLLVLQETEMYTEINNVRSALLDTFGEKGCNILRDIRLLVNKKTVAFVQADGRTIDYDCLSGGYCRLFSIVIDIAFRCALLNKGMFGDEAYKHTHGTVIIDEIDEHLHPELQVRILKALHEAFPKLQLIVSTHAPLVMSSVESNADNVVYKLGFKDGVYTHKELNTYGLDATTIMNVYMGNAARDLEVADGINKVFSLIDAENYQSAREELNKLKGELANGDPELARAEAILSFMEG